MNLAFLVFDRSSTLALLASVAAKNSLKDYLIYCGVIVVLALALLIWAVAFRKPRRKRKRKSHSRRYPTLSETRGLPPNRDERFNPPDHYES